MCYVSAKGFGRPLYLGTRAIQGCTMGMRQLEYQYLFVSRDFRRPCSSTGQLVLVVRPDTAAFTDCILLLLVAVVVFLTVCWCCC